MGAKEGTTVEQKGVSHHYDSVKAAMRQATKEPPVANKRLGRIYGKGVEKVNHKLESLQLSRKDQVSMSRLRSGHHADLKYWLHKIGRALDTVSQKCGMREGSVEHAIGESPWIHHPATQISEPYLIATNPSKPWSCGRKN